MEASNYEEKQRFHLNGEVPEDAEIILTLIHDRIHFSRVLEEFNRCSQFNG